MWQEICSIKGRKTSINLGDTEVKYCRVLASYLLALHRRSSQILFCEISKWKFKLEILVHQYHQGTD